MTTINTGSLRTPPPYRGDSVANYSARSSPTRRNVTNADKYYLTLHYYQVRLLMPPPPYEGGGGNQYTCCIQRLR